MAKAKERNDRESVRSFTEVNGVLKELKDLTPEEHAEFIARVERNVSQVLQNIVNSGKYDVVFVED